MPFTTEKTITVVYNAPIPVGHKVKVQFFSRTKGILKKKSEEQVHHPLITDEDTGIEYGSYWHYKNVMAMSSGSYEPEEYPLKVLDELEQSEQYTGIVKKCRLLTETFSDIWRVQTTLIIETE